MKQLKIKEVSTILKKYIFKSDVRPVLQNAYVTENNIFATDSHQLIKIDRNIVEDEFFTNETKLFNPKTNTYVTSDSNYPDVSRLIPDHANAELTITSDSIKRVLNVIKYFQHVSGDKKNTLININTYENEIVLAYLNKTEATYSNFYNTGIKTNDNITVNVNGEFYKNMLSSLQKALKVLKQSEISMKYIGEMRPMVFETTNKEMTVMVLPVRSYGYSGDITIADNQDVTIVKEETVKSTVKQVVLFSSGIVNKRVVEHKQVNDFTTYVLKEDVTNIENNYIKEVQERAFNNLMLYAEIDEHLFNVCRVDQIEQLQQYNTTQLLDMFKSQLESGLKENKTTSLGLAQYFNMEAERTAAIEAMELQKQREAEEKQKQIELAEKEKQAERNEELKEAANKLLSGEMINSNDFLELCDQNNIIIPLRTRGWIINKLMYISKGNYKAYTHSTKVFEYVELLVAELEKQNNIETTQTINNTQGIKQYFEGIESNKRTPNPIEYIQHGKYAIELSEGIDRFAVPGKEDAKIYTIKAVNMETEKQDETMFSIFEEGKWASIIYLSKEAALKEIANLSHDEHKETIPINNKSNLITT